MQRITIEKNEAVADLIERILEVQDREITLVVPRGSRLVDSSSNFRLIAREAGVLAKEISIESVDEEVLAHAKTAGLRASHPLFDDRAVSVAVGDAGGVSDIVARGRGKKAAAEKAEKEKKAKHVKPEPVRLHVQHEDEPEEEEEETTDDDMEAGAAAGMAAGAAMEPQELDDADESDANGHNDYAQDQGYMVTEGEGEDRYDTLDRPRRGSGGGKKVLAWIVGIIVVVGGIMFLTAYAFGKATVTVSFQKSPWTYSGSVNALVSAKTVDANNNAIPLEIASPQSKTYTDSFPATGHTTGGTKAHGTLTIVNDYSGAPQELVATTRFQTADGKIYRLDSATVVPGATVDGTGKVIATSTIKVPVTADQPGPSYNIGATDHLTIPGFKNSPKYAGFYGVLADGATGGSTNGGAVPTDADIMKAKATLAAKVGSSFQADFLASMPGDFKVLPQAISSSTINYTVSQAVDAQGNFTAEARAAFNVFEFREADVTALLDAKAAAQAGQGKTVQDLTITYNNAVPNFSAKKMTFTVDVRGTVVPQFDPAAFASQVAGKSRNEARQALLGLPDLQDAKVSLWPAWAWMLPKNPSKITVVVQ